MRLFAATAFAFLSATALSAGLSAPADAARPIAFGNEARSDGALVLVMRSAADLDARGVALDANARQTIERAIAADEFRFRHGSTLTLRGVGNWRRVVLIGAGSEPLDARRLQVIGGVAARETASVDGPVTLVARGIDGAGHIATGARLGGYSFDAYKSDDPDSPRPAGRDAPLTILADGNQADADWRREGNALADAVNFARDLVNEPANTLYPEVFVERTRAAFANVRGVTIDVLDENQMRELGMGSILSVGQGSERPPRMLVVQYRGGGTAQPILLAGKGITFDTGGISLKPGNSMLTMKGDMAGAAAVVGTALSLARSGAPVNVVAIAALAENMPSGTATRPSDVVRAMNGTTIEITSTDAEGRMVLADALVYGERQFRPAAIVDIATLTGAKVTALGSEYAALFSRSEELAGQIEASGEATGELVWRMPLNPVFRRALNSDIADIRQGGSPAPGASAGAHFIGAFVTDATPWAHIDIAGNEISSSASNIGPSGAVGYGVRLLDHFVRNFQPVPATPAEPDADAE